MFLITLLEAKDKVVRAALLVVAPVTAGPRKADPGTAQLVRTNKKDKIKILINI